MGIKMVITSTLQQYFLLLLCLTVRCEKLAGPGEFARIIPHSETIAAEDLPLEHRGGGGSGLLLPDVFSVSRNVTSQLDVDLFFSLFFVFLNNQFDESHENFTIFSPAALPTQEATKWLSAQEELTEELLLNHIVLGDHLRPELMGHGAVKTTLGGLDVSFKIDDNGELWVNDVKIVAWKTEGRALIIAMEDYLFKQEVEEEVQHLKEIKVGEEEELFRKSGTLEDEQKVEEDGLEVESENELKIGEFVPTPRNQEKNCTKVENKSGLSIFKSITVCTESVSMVNFTEDRREPQVRKIETRLTILEELENQLTFLRGGPSLTYFLTYANTTGLEENLEDKEPMTLLAPLDEAFQTWHPIDWGFNPFAVESFLAELMENLVVSEAIDITENDEKLTEKVFKTLGGETVKMRTKGENIYVNEALLLGHMRLVDSSAQVLFLDQVPWIDLDIVEQLRSNFSHLETGPPIFNGSLEPPDYEQIMDTTTMLTDIFEDEENQTDGEGLIVTVNDPVNFPTTISSLEMDDIRLTNSPAPFFSIL